jgi:hypothetical protein
VPVRESIPQSQRSPGPNNLAEANESILGLALPAFAAVDRFMSAYLEPLPRLVAWGCLMASLVMLLYRLISPQQKIARIRLEAAATRKQMAAFDGDFGDLAPIVRNSLKLSLMQIAWIFFPALIASLPLLGCLIWLDSAYGYRTPPSGQAVRLTVWPETEQISSLPAAALDRSPDGWRVEWLQADDAARLFDRQGATLATLSGTPSNDVIGPYYWWNSLIGNPMGYLPADSPVRRLEFGFVPAEVLDWGPPWMRRWEPPFFLSLIVLSILFKVVFRIE